MAQGNFNLNASASTAANTLDASGFATNGIAIQGGSGVDTITGSAQADAITGGAGNDILNGKLPGVATSAADVLQAVQVTIHSPLRVVLHQQRFTLG